MPNPKAAKGPLRTSREVESELDGFVRRIRLLGADDDAVASVREAWDQFDEDWTPERRAQLVRMTDPDLRAEILKARDEYDLGTTDQADADQADYQRAYNAANADALGRMGTSVRQLLEWVGDDRVRAHAVLDLETSAEGANRKTLVAGLHPVINAPAG